MGAEFLRTLNAVLACGASPSWQGWPLAVYHARLQISIHLPQKGLSLLRSIFSRGQTPSRVAGSDTQAGALPSFLGSTVSPAQGAGLHGSAFADARGGLLVLFHFIYLTA